MVNEKSRPELFFEEGHSLELYSIVFDYIKQKNYENEEEILLSFLCATLVFTMERSGYSNERMSKTCDEILYGFKQLRQKRIDESK